MNAMRLLAILVAGMLLGWATAQKIISIDCEQLGAFYEGTKIRRCAASASNPINRNEGAPS